MEHSVSGVGVLDKAVEVLDSLAEGPKNLTELVAATGLPRATAHRLAVALQVHDLVRRDGDGRFALGFGLATLGRAALDSAPLAPLSRPALVRLRDETEESAQLYVRDGDHRVCIESFASPHGLRTIVAVGAALPLRAGSAGHVLLGEPVPDSGWVESIEEREPGVASVSAPVRDRSGTVVAAVSVSGPIERTSRKPGRRYGAAVLRAARSVEEAAGFA
ncbi:MAG TPA: IclR family transcriptional regulator [Acidimicrobiales bacterium]